ncbi:MAG TPA: DUF4446 family protein [Candidatus Ornithomonoglobus intestinigallinarum]|uniref:DUF4446 family protein n=1 Tax=Candidatus Ornithomonoglobus intestinigallinarum TaxID=2840894 RepID=A0A9D1KQW2_9FIRM|nr:DUF4446 family protein [Candidatus Ornithomonoglobus intestinigallinarum]
MTGQTLLIAAFGIIIVLVLICFILTMINSSKVNTLLDYSEDGDIIGALKEYYKKVDDLAKTVNENSDAVTQSRLAGCESLASSSLKKTGIVHFDAFDDVTGKLSFAAAVLNSSNDGFILTSLYGHNSCNTYVREIENGRASVKLLNEETQALKKAVSGIKKGQEDGSEQE